MTRYPTVLSEDSTLRAALAGRSLSRYGDGELKLALGHTCISQVATPALAAELKAILANHTAESPCLVCIPNLESKTKDAWGPYRDPKYLALYADEIYGSAFISRPDSAPWIDTPEYWSMVEDLWRGKDIVLVAGTERSLRPGMLTSAASIRTVEAPRRDAYAEVDRIQEEIGKPAGPVLLCVGATSTVLGARLAGKVHALDLGHLGMFMRHAGAYRFSREELLSNNYKRLLEQQHGKSKWGNDGHKHLEAVYELAVAQQAATILDYGCGEGSLRRAWEAAGLHTTLGVRIMEYDPGMKGRDTLPKPCDLVVCTDVLEHVEPEKLDAVLAHLFSIAGKMAYAVIATRPANATLPDGRNAHLIVKPWDWWHRKLTGAGWTVARMIERAGRDVSVCLTK